MSELQISQPSVGLRDGQTVTIRRLAEDDRAMLLAFGQGLPRDDLLYLEDDFQSPDTISRLINASYAENWRQIVAVQNDAIIGYSAVRREPGWSNHVASVRMLVGADWRRRGLGTALARAIFDAAQELGADKVIVQMVQEQIAGQAIFERLGFRVEGVLSEHVRDRHGRRHNLVILAYHVRRA